MEVKIDGNDGDYKFRLVENIRHPEPFIICEIINPINIESAVASASGTAGMSCSDGGDFLSPESLQWNSTVVGSFNLNHVWRKQDALTKSYQPGEKMARL